MGVFTNSQLWVLVCIYLLYKTILSKKMRTPNKYKQLKNFYSNLWGFGRIVFMPVYGYVLLLDISV